MLIYIKGINVILSHLSGCRKASCGISGKDIKKRIKACLKNAIKAGSIDISIRFPECNSDKHPQILRILTDEIFRYSSSGLYTLHRIRLGLSGRLWSAGLKNIIKDYEGYLSRKEGVYPIPTVDIIIEHPRGIILVKRKNPPLGWAIPGGFVDYGESLEAAARREAKEETDLSVKSLHQFHTYSKPSRDPRFHTISTVFIAVASGCARPRSDAVEIGFFKKNRIPKKIAFDHRNILIDYFDSFR